MIYKFEIKTGDQSGAGTDSNIFLVLYGEYGQTTEVRLNGYCSGNAFERNKTDSFAIMMSDDVGRVYQIDLRSDCKYAGSDWLLSNIKITRVGNMLAQAVLGKADETDANLTSVFHINKWINNQATQQFFTNYDNWESVEKYETILEKYKSYPVEVPPNSEYFFEKKVVTYTSFFFKDVITKKTTTAFNTEMGSKSSFSATAGLAEGLSATAASEKFLKFGFSKVTEKSELNETTKTENREISETVKQVLRNDTDKHQVYEAVFSLIKVNAISRMNSVIALFSANSEVVFTGFKLVSSK
jgi:hypothetical protein